MGISNCNCLYVDSSTCLFNDFFEQFRLPFMAEKGNGFSVILYMCTDIL